ncbi:MAG TPA: hypothetical protein VMD29_04360 [Terracidiphilus sp.]|nr:hypothetical protein [Terracidiphilus sp.]
MGLLNACLAETDPVRADALLGELVSAEVEPLALRVVSFRLRRHGAAHHAQIEDVASDAVVAFLLQVDEIRQGRAPAVDNLEAFVAVLAARACNDYFRRAHPAFHALRNKLRYLLERYPELARWQDPASGAWICGLHQWRAPGERLRPVAGDVDDLEGLEKALGVRHPADQLAALFRVVDAPIRFNDLAVLMARLWNVQESGTGGQELAESADSACSVDVTLGRKQWLAIVWKNICALSRNQRIALLLNLRGGDRSCAASLLVVTGVAGLRQIAQAVEMPAPEFAALWKRLPLGDLEIADLLGLTRQQVINLRKCAREKLVRRLGAVHAMEW